VAYIQGRDSSDYVATSYKLDGPSYFPGILYFLLSAVFSNVHVLQKFVRRVVLFHVPYL
jgi:hypothetical protein